MLLSVTRPTLLRSLYHRTASLSGSKHFFNFSSNLTMDASTAPAAQSTAPAPAPEKPALSEAELISLLQKVDIRVGKMVSVEKHPGADKLYVEKVDLGEEAPRTVVSGLVAYLTPEQIQDKLCCFVCNLKPAAMRGVVSQAMVLCSHEAAEHGKLELLVPPEGAVPGDRVTFDGLTFAEGPEAQLNPKKKIFESIQPQLSIESDGAATFLKKHRFQVAGKGYVTVPTIRNGNIS